MRKLVVWADAWLPWADEFRQRLGDSWKVISCREAASVLEEVRDADALVALDMPGEVREAARRLKVMLYPGAGYPEMSPGGLPAGCLLSNVYEHEGPIAEYVLMTMLVHATRLLRHLGSFREGAWEGSGRVGGEPHEELAGRTVGFFGFGHIGQAVAARGEAFGMHIEAVTRSRGSLDDMLPRCDYLVIAAPLTPETRGRIGVAELALLPRHAFLINVARAEIVCEDALYAALASRSIAGAALDVWYEYPSNGERGRGSRLPFQELTNVICTPHYSAWTRPMILRRIDRMAENLQRLARGEALERVVMQGTWTP